MATAIWTGSLPDNHSWNYAQNWANNYMPGLADTVLIENNYAVVNAASVGSLIMNNASVSVLGGRGALMQIGISTPGVISGGLIYLDTNARLFAGNGITSATGVIKIGQSSSYQWDGANSTQTIQMDYRPDSGFPNSVNGTFAFSTQFDGTIESFYASNIIDYNGAGTVTGMMLSGQTVTFTTTAGNYTVTFGNDVNLADLRFDVGTGSIRTIQIGTNVPCFTTGTLIRTERGEIAVEALQIGDVVITVANEYRPIVWLGHYSIKRAEASNFQSLCPIRIQAGAFGEGMPYADLWLSPGHAVCVRVLDEVLIPVGYLVNGATISQLDVDEVTYWHVELGSHDVLVANGLPAESYLDCGSRDWFQPLENTFILDRKSATPAEYCRPLIVDGTIVEAVATRLRARAELLGWARITDADVHLLADGLRIEPDFNDSVARFLVPARARDFRLVSRTFVPAEWSDSGDRRQLGISIHGLHIDDGIRCRRDIDIDDPRLAEGFHYLETSNGKSWRWTNGSLKLPRELWADCSFDIILSISIDVGSSRHWVAVSNSKMQSPERIDSTRSVTVSLQAA